MDTPGGPPLRWGICGTGRIAAKFVDSLGAVPDAEVVAVGSSDPVRAQWFADRHGIPRAHDRAGLAGDDGIDIVYVAVTQEAHRDATVEMLQAGRHVLCEKPLAMDAGQAREMVSAAHRHDRFLMEAMWTRFLPAYVHLEEVLDRGEIGRPVFVDADLSLRVPDEEVATHRLMDPHRGGGSLLDVGVYPLQLSRLVLGHPDGITAVADLAGGVDIQTTLLLEHPGGGASALRSAIRANGTSAATIVGEEGLIEVHPRMHHPPALTVRRGDRERTVEFADSGLHHQVPAVHAAVRDGRLECPKWPWSESLAMLEVADEARRQMGLAYPWE